MRAAVFAIARSNRKNRVGLFPTRDDDRVYSVEAELVDEPGRFAAAAVTRGRLSVAASTSS
jgi:hypothetical protein